METEQFEHEPMITITVRQRDALLYRIRELEGELIAVRARIKIIENEQESRAGG